MPRQDGTGPFADGRPGRGLGPCGRFVTAGSYNRSLGNNIINILLELLRSYLNKKKNK